ncbi:DUF1320 domain-containing protein [Aequorivita sp. H23M31]|uniref:DUF1320 domain-containing protein n=1 Tax=Aequorivita ciconiae TaxID=2494375 RepID=A0A410G2C5_9FLAO|nr:phage protein Gp36 family protein [Aequorivita sp. H23M31]QAA81400.1 DUF1320 domain-containing protein [Aequorivita sp. H23M31]
MIYLQKEDLITHAFERLIDESSNDFANTLKNVEAENIGILKSYLGAVYDVDTIFDENAPIRNALLVRILTKMVLYDVVRRNAARKVPADYVEEYKNAIETLEKIAFGKLEIKGLPAAIDDQGEVISTTLFGDNRNPNFYI